MSDESHNLLIGQYFIYTLRVLEFYLRNLTKDPVFVEKLVVDSIEAIEQGDKKREAELDAVWLNRLESQLHKGRCVSPRQSIKFSSVRIGEFLFADPKLLKDAASTKYRAQTSRIRNFAANLNNYMLAFSLSNQNGEAPYRVTDYEITPQLARIIGAIINEGTVFKGRTVFYYLFFRWHRIDYADLEKVKQGGIDLPYREELMNLLLRLGEWQLDFDIPDIAAELDVYFDYYARFITDASVINALEYPSVRCAQYNSPEETRRLLLDLWRVHRAFYTLASSGGSCSVVADGLSLYESPRITDSIGLTHGHPTWTGSFESAFAGRAQRQKRVGKVLSHLHWLATQKAGNFNKAKHDFIKLLIQTANMIPVDAASFHNSIHSYAAVQVADKRGEFLSPQGLNHVIPYLPFIDSQPDDMLGFNDFCFQADETRTVPPLEAGLFAPMIDTLCEDARHRAISAGFSGISEYKIYLYEAAEHKHSMGAVSQPAQQPAQQPTPQPTPQPRFTFKAGRSDYFTGVARKDLFARYLVPTPGNLRQPLVYLLERGELPGIVSCPRGTPTSCKDERCKGCAQLDACTLTNHVQKQYSHAEQSSSSLVRLAKVLGDDPITERKLIDSLGFYINCLYDKLIDRSLTRDANGTFHFKDNGSAYTGCGTFVLTSDTDSSGNDRPYLLMERRWKVSEENNNLSYPSGASCDFYVPEERMPLAQTKLKDLEANPFKTAARELREELNVIADPRDLTLISFGIDVNRNLQQFSFLYESPYTAERILARKSYAATPTEGLTFALPFERQSLLDILNNYQMESGAVYSLMHLMTLKANRLWP